MLCEQFFVVLWCWCASQEPEYTVQQISSNQDNASSKAHIPGAHLESPKLTPEAMSNGMRPGSDMDLV